MTFAQVMEPYLKQSLSESKVCALKHLTHFPETSLAIGIPAWGSPALDLHTGPLTLPFSIEISAMGSILPGIWVLDNPQAPFHPKTTLKLPLSRRSHLS